MSADTRKLIFVVLYELILFTLILTNKVHTDIAIPLMTAMAGYVVGNGYNSLQGRISTPVIVPKDKKEVPNVEDVG